MPISKFFEWLRKLFRDGNKLYTIVRVLIALGVILRYFFNDFATTPARLGIYWLLALIGFIVYTALLYKFGKGNQGKISKLGKWLPILLDTFFITLFYYLTHFISSDFFLFYYLPILAASDLFDRREQVIVLTIIILGLSIAALLIGKNADLSTTEVIVKTLLPRLSIFSLILYVSVMKSGILREQGEVMTALSVTAAKVSYGDDVETRLETIMNTAMDLLNAKGCKVYLYRPNQRLLELVALKGINSPVIKKGYSLKLNQGMAGSVFFNETPLAVSDYSQYPRRIPELAHLFGAVLEVPIFYGIHPIGVIAVLDKKKRQFTKEDSELLIRLSPYLANAIHDIQLVDELRLQTNALTILNEAGQEMNANFNNENTYRAIAKYAWKLSNLYQTSEAELAYVGVCNQDMLTLEFVSAYPNDFHDKLIRKVGTIHLTKSPIGIIGKAILSATTMMVNQVESESEYIKFNPNTKSQLAVPIIVFDTPVGVISVEHSEERAFTNQLKNNMEILSNQAAAAIQNTKFFAKNKAQFDRTVNLYQSFASGNFNNDLRQTAKSLLDNLQKVLPFSRATLQLFDGDQRRIVAKRGLPKDKIDPQLTRPLNDDLLIKSVVDSREIVILSPPSIHPHWNMYLTTSDIETWLCIPLITGDSVSGIITVDFVKQYLIPDDLKILLKIFSNQAAGLISNVQLLEKHKERLVELSQAQEQLKRVLQYYDEKQNLINIGLIYGEDIHYAKSRLGLALSQASRIAKGKSDSESVKQKAMEIIDNINLYLTKLGEIQELVAEPLSSTEVDLHALLKETVSMKYQSLWQKWIQIDYDFKSNKPLVRAPGKQLRQVFLVILQNAIEATRRKDEHIIISTENVAINKKQFVKVSITDRGEGIPPEIQAGLFKYRLKNTEPGHSGMGLMWARSFMRSFEGLGDINFETQAKIGTTMIVHVPLDFGKSIFLSPKVVIK